MSTTANSAYAQHITGADAEQAAATHLEQAGLLLIETNFRCKSGEIDLIMRDDQTLVFVEVRYRNNSNFGSPLETVTAQKQRKLRAAAHLYLQRNGKTDCACRFDVVGIMPGKERSSARDINWCKNAF